MSTPVRNFPTCKHRKKADPDIWDSKADPENWRPIDGEFWHCTAQVQFPTFVRQLAAVQYTKCLNVFNIKLFDEDTTYYEGLQRDCPLWELTENEPYNVHNKQYCLNLEGYKRGRSKYKDA